MSYRVEKNGDIVILGFDKGVASSPHQGIANLQNVNIATEQGEVMVSYGRVQQSMTNLTASYTISPLDGTHLSTSAQITAGVWINVSASTITGLSTGNYYIANGTNSSFQLATSYENALAGTVLTGLGATGTATYSIIKNMSESVHAATESYSDGTNQKYRYYILDSQGLVWVKDTGVSTTGVEWFLPDTSVGSFSGTPTGIAVLNGWLMIFIGVDIWCKPTVLLGATPGWVKYTNAQMVNSTATSAPHFAFVGHQGKLYYTDGNYIGSIFPNISLVATTAPNVQSYCSYTASTTTGTVSAVIGGSLPTNGDSTGATRIPAVFFSAGTKPTAITVGTVYWIKYLPLLKTFEVYAASSGGVALDIQTGAVGTQYFNTFYPTSVGGATLSLWTAQRVALPFYEIAQNMVEIGNNLIIGCRSNILYFWNQISNLPQDLIPLPENDVQDMVTVNNMAYIFAGHKGNVYVTNGNTASAVISVPDYCAGIAGTPSSYIEPYFTWGSAMYLRGRVYFSIQDQTSTKAGNCGGVWSFVPTQNMFIGQNTGLSLRLENQNSYGTYNGMATDLIAAQDQTAKSPQYYSAWKSNSFTSPTYGIDFTATTPVAAAIIETDLIPTGTVLNKKTFSQIEYKCSSPLVSGESITIKYRQNATDAWTSCGTIIVDSATETSGYVPINFEANQSTAPQGGQWIQLQITLNALTSPTSSFIRLSQIIIR